MTQFLEYQVFLSYRIPLDEEGRPAGSPQLTAQNFVRPIKGTSKAPKKKATEVSAEQDDEILL